MSATAWVSAAEPDRQHHIVSCTCVSLSVTRFAIYAPVVVRLSAPRITPSPKVTAMLRRSQSPLSSHVEIVPIQAPYIDVPRLIPPSQYLTKFRHG